MPTVTPKFVFKFMQSRVEAVAQTLVGSIRIAMPSPKSLAGATAKAGAEAQDAVIATNVLLSIRPGEGAGAPIFLNELPVRKGEGSWSVELPDLSAGAKHWLLFEIALDHRPDTALSRRRVAEIELAWSPNDPGKGNRRTRLNADVELVNPVLVEPPDPLIQERHALMTAGLGRR